MSVIPALFFVLIQSRHRHKSDKILLFALLDSGLRISRSYMNTGAENEKSTKNG